MRKMIADSICGMDDFIKCENSKMLEKRDILVSVWKRENPYLAAIMNTGIHSFIFRSRIFLRRLWLCPLNLCI